MQNLVESIQKSIDTLKTASGRLDAIPVQGLAHMSQFLAGALEINQVVSELQKALQESEGETTDDSPNQ
ncbi:MAG: hypothetical protein LIO46_02350 [Clostridiales bacterium]|nr:hypothetical protein [Clostridiales bacterium]